jgi:hypothetical protein
MIKFAEQYPITTTKVTYHHHSSWTGHIPFAMLAVELVRPALLVELGTHRGASYLAFCQAVAALDTSTRCYAVDTWQGDEHTGPYGDEVLRSLRTIHDPLYGSFSTLMPMTFDDAASRFENGSIDLLHIDGCHTYDAVRHDFETWRPRLSNRGVVLFHDTVERNDEHQFGVWRLWDEISRCYPSFNFTHEHGLGIVAVGENYARSLDILFKASPEEAAQYRAQFCELGFPLKTQELEMFAAGTSEHLALLQQQVADLEHFGAGMRDANSELAGEVAALRADLDAASRRHQRNEVDLVRLQHEQAAATTQLEQLNKERDLLYRHVAAIEKQKSELEERLAALDRNTLLRFVRKLQNRP